MSKADDKQLRREVILAVIQNTSHREISLLSYAETVLHWINTGDRQKTNEENTA